MEVTRHGVERPNPEPREKREAVRCDDGIVRWSTDPKAKGQAEKREAERVSNLERDTAAGFVVPDETGEVIGISSGDFTQPETETSTETAPAE